MGFQDAINRASKDIAMARRQLLQLNLADAGVQMPQLEAENEEQEETSPDQEEAQLRLQLQNALQACADSVGPLNLEAARLEDLAHQDMDEDEESKKRKLAAAALNVPAPTTPTAAGTPGTGI